MMLSSFLCCLFFFFSFTFLWVFLLPLSFDLSAPSPQLHLRVLSGCLLPLPPKLRNPKPKASSPEGTRRRMSARPTVSRPRVRLIPPPNLHLVDLKMTAKRPTAVADAVRTSLGPKGMDKMVIISNHDLPARGFFHIFPFFFQIQTPNKEVIITNDGATILDKLELVHPAAKMVPCRGLSFPMCQTLKIDSNFLVS